MTQINIALPPYDVVFTCLILNSEQIKRIDILQCHNNVQTKVVDVNIKRKNCSTHIVISTPSEIARIKIKFLFFFRIIAIVLME